SAGQRVGMLDRTFRAEMDWGLGVIRNTRRASGDASSPAALVPPYGFGPGAGTRTFGHGGSQSSVAWCDPDHDLVGALLFNGLCGEPAHQRRLKLAMAA